MALVFEQDLLAPFPIVDPRDGALADFDRAEFPATKEGEAEWNEKQAAFKASWAEFEKTGRAEVLLCRGDLKPTVFWAKVPSPVLAEAVGLGVAFELAPGGKLARAVATTLDLIAYCVTSIENLKQRVNGEVVVRKVEFVQGQHGKRLSDDDMQIFADDELRQRVFLAIKRRTKLTPEQQKSDPR